MNTLSDLGRQFQALRKAAGLTQDETARRAGMLHEALSRFERGRGADFSLAKCLRLAQALGHDLAFVSASSRPTLDDVLAERRQAGATGGKRSRGSIVPTTDNP